MEELEDHIEGAARDSDDEEEDLELLAEPVKKKNSFTKKIKKVRCYFCNDHFMYEYRRYQARPKCKVCRDNGVSKKLSAQVLTEKYCYFCKNMFPIYPSMMKKMSNGKVVWKVNCTFCNARHGAPKGPLPRQDRKYFECDLCGKCFKARHLIYIHMDNHRGRDEFTCRVCNKKSKNRCVLRVHLRSHFETFVCHLCGFQTSTNSSYKSHMDGHEADPNQIREYKIDEDRQQNNKKSEETGEYPCKYCGYVFTTKNGLKSHETRRHESMGVVNDFKCKTCGEVFPTFMEHRNHTFTHSNLPLLFCTHPGCSQFFNRLKKLNSHIRNVHKDNNITCEKCGKKFKLKASLQKHLRNNRCVPVRIRKSNLGVGSLMKSRKNNKDPELLQQEATIAKQQYREMGGILDQDNEKSENSENQQVSEKIQKKMKKVLKTRKESESESEYDEYDEMPLSVAQHNFEVEVKEEYVEELPIVQIKVEPEEPMQISAVNVEVKEEPIDNEVLPLYLLSPNIEPQVVLERMEDTEILMNYQKMNESEISEPEEPKLWRNEKIIRRPKRLTPSLRYISKSGNKYVCDVCDLSFRTKALFREHFAKHETNIIKCKFCPEEFPKRAALRTHLSEQHGLKYNDALRCIDDPYICDLCGKHYPNFGSISSHLKITHKKGLDFQCHICSSKFKAKMYLNRHIEDVHERIYRFCCKFCGKFFRRNHQVKEHERLHNDPQPCTICGKMVRNMKTHVRNVHEIAPQKKTDYQICPECGKMVAVNNMKHHIARIHQKEPIPGKIYPCIQCSENFVRENDLRRHKIINHSTKPYKTCPYEGCDGVFYRTKPLNVHIKNTHRENKLTCKHCGKSFQSESGFRKHLMKKHKEEFAQLPEANQHRAKAHGELPPVESSQSANENVFS